VDCEGSPDGYCLRSGAAEPTLRAAYDSALECRAASIAILTGHQGLRGSVWPGHSGTGGWIMGYSDAGRCGDRNSTTGHLFLLNRSWASAKQRRRLPSPSISPGTGREAEPMAAGTTRGAAASSSQGNHSPCPYRALTRPALRLPRTRPAEAHIRAVPLHPAAGKATIDYVPTESMLADILTNPPPRQRSNAVFRE
jgi:hypothetical protein